MDDISESLETVFGSKYLNYLMRIRKGKIRIQDGKNSDPDPGWKKFGSGISIPDPQHWLFLSY
jgi:hypothetical protein